MSRQNKKADLESLIEESLQNIREDRAMASTLLIDIMGHISTNKHEHKETGPIAAKYLETLQRSNEQLVKLNALLFKKSSSSPGLTSEDREQLYDLIEGEANGDN
tara:strand:- start:343 stop:657 length:315 start_codon:yes stop_codon:yes gene_type:complete